MLALAGSLKAEPQRSLSWMFLALLVMTAGTVLACKVPVFRYALERWPTDSYRAVAMIDGDPSDELQQALEQLQSLAGSGANITTDVIDLSSLSEQELWQLEEFDGSAEPPLLQLFYPAKDGQRQLCWQGELSAEHVNRWGSSPLRQQIADDLTNGVSAVFLLVEGSDQRANDLLAAEMREWLKDAANVISIPEGVIPKAQASKYLAAHPEATMDDVLRSDLPLRVEFRWRLLARDNQDETALLAMINGLTDRRDHPLVVPIFGRGRMLDAIPANRCDRDTILNACRYIVGECSCTVKTLNPGVDLLLAVDWSAKLGESVVMMEPPRSSLPTRVAIPEGHSVRGEAATGFGGIQDGSEKQISLWVWGLIGFAFVGGIGLAIRLRRDVFHP